MLNFSAISAVSPLGKLMRFPLRLLPKDTALPIVQGPLRGRLWLAGSSDHGCWLGSYELDKQKKMMELLRPGMVCWDIGAHVGFYTLLFSKLVAPNGSVLAFEPVPRNCEILKRHLQMNGCANAYLMPMALADHDGEAWLEEGPTSTTARLSSRGDRTVQCRRIDTLLSSGEQPPDVMKLDVEGSEAAVLQGARQLLSAGKVIAFVATHGADAYAACLQLFRQQGYRVTGLDGEPNAYTGELVAYPE